MADLTREQQIRQSAPGSVRARSGARCPYCKPGAPCYACDPHPDPATACPECKGRGWHVGDCHPRETCGVCDGTGRAFAAKLPAPSPTVGSADEGKGAT
jgi:hypothetical protein